MKANEAGTQEAFMQFLKQSYGQKGDMSEESMENLASELEKVREEGGSVEEISKLLQDKLGDSNAAAERPNFKQIRPTGVMCIKTWDINEQKVFFNMCTSTSIDPPEQVIRDGQEQTRLPLSLGAPLDDVDRKGDPVVVYDAVFNPETLKQADATFTQFLVELTMIRVEEKYPERPALNAKRKWKRLRQTEWKGREIQEQNIREEATVRVVDEDSGLRDFSRPEAAEPVWAVTTTRRKRDAAPVVRLRVELPAVRPEEITVRSSGSIVSVMATHLGEITHKAECACERPLDYTLLSSRFHAVNHTLTLVWGPAEAKQFDEAMALKAKEAAEAAAEKQRIQLSNNAMFDIDCSSDDD